MAGQGYTCLDFVQLSARARLLTSGRLPLVQAGGLAPADVLWQTHAAAARFVVWVLGTDCIRGSLGLSEQGNQLVKGASPQCAYQASQSSWTTTPGVSRGTAR